MKTVYITRIYNAKHLITTFREVIVNEVKGELFYLNGDKIHISKHESISHIKPKYGINIEGRTLLPSFADIKQDIPRYVKHKPKVYHNCQLMVETKSGYLYYWHPVAGKLLIAINSNYYL